MAVFNQLAHGCGNLIVSALELQGSDIFIYFCVQCIDACVSVSNHCVYCFAQSSNGLIVLTVVQIWGRVLLLECKVLIIGQNFRF